MSSSSVRVLATRLYLHGMHLQVRSAFLALLTHQRQANVKGGPCASSALQFQHIWSGLWHSPTWPKAPSGHDSSNSWSLRRFKSYMNQLSRATLDFDQAGALTSRKRGADFCQKGFQHTRVPAATSLLQCHSSFRS